jgi:hypothetical protein
MTVITMYEYIFELFLRMAAVGLTVHNALHIVFGHFAMPLDVRYHLLHFIAKNLQIVFYPLGLDRIATRDHTQGREGFFEKIEFGIIDAEKVQWVYAVYVNADLCQCSWI